MALDLPNPLGLTAHEFARAWARAGAPGGAAAGLERYARFFREGLASGEGLDVPVAPVVREHRSESGEGTVVKFCQRVPGPPGAPADKAYETESVLIPMIGKKRVRSYTLCVSSQVGCAMGCVFCQTAQMGLIRSLSAEEIVAQWFAARHLVSRPDPEAAIANIVFMGMGEPTDNLDEVIRAVSVLIDHRGPSIATSKITISTVGNPAGIARLAEVVKRPGWHRLGLALSLNAPNDEVRSKIMPVNRAWPLASLRAALGHWPLHGGAHLCLEYVLIPGVNDAPEHADELASFVLGEEYEARAPGSRRNVPRYAGAPLKGLVNVIPYNPRDHSPWPAPSEEMIVDFVARLTATSVYVKRRRTKGRDQMAACGQLGNPALRRTRVGVTVGESAR